MVVVTLTDSPPKLRGDLSKWLMEINTGVYVGNVSARVRDELWERICENLKNGRATMVFNAEGEQHMDFRVHNTTWEPVDFDGLKLMRHPSTQKKKDNEMGLLRNGYSKAAQYQKIKNVRKGKMDSDLQDYTVIDLETSGLNVEKDAIIEIGALKIRNGEAAAEFDSLIKINFSLPDEIVNLTGITDQLLEKDGVPLGEALDSFTNFIGKDILVGYNIRFDLLFLKRACLMCQRELISNQSKDALILAKRKLKALPSHRLEALGDYFGIDYQELHRALPDCHLTQNIFQKLNEK